MIRRLLTLTFVACAGVASAQSLSSEFNSNIPHVDGLRLSPSYSLRRGGVTGDFTNHFQNRIDSITRPRVTYYRPNIVVKQHANHGAAQRGMAAQAGSLTWRREAYLAKQFARRAAEIGPRDQVAAVPAQTFFIPRN